MVTAPQDPYLSPDGHWRWDGAQWVPSGYSWYVPAPPRSAHDGKAIASFVISLVGMCGINSVVAVVLGHQSRREARQDNRDPSGLALAGIIIGYVGIAVAAGLLALFVLVPGVSEDCSGDCGGSAQVPPAPAGQIAVTLHSAGDAEAAFHQAHGTYTDSLPALSELGFHAEHGVTVEVVLARADEYCMRGYDERTTYFLSTAQEAVSDSPCG